MYSCTYISGSVNTTAIVRSLCDVRVSGKSQMAGKTENRFEITCNVYLGLYT